MISGSSSITRQATGPQDRGARAPAVLAVAPPAVMLADARAPAALAVAVAPLAVTLRRVPQPSAGPWQRPCPAPECPGGTSLRSLPVGLRAWSHPHRQAEASREASHVASHVAAPPPCTLTCWQMLAPPHSLQGRSHSGYGYANMRMMLFLLVFQNQTAGRCPVSLGVAPLAVMLADARAPAFGEANRLP
jgi:hypothetical protein